MGQSFFENLVWLKERMLLGDMVFRIEHFKNNGWELGDDCFRFYKIKQLIEEAISSKIDI